LGRPAYVQATVYRTDPEAHAVPLSVLQRCPHLQNMVVPHVWWNDEKQWRNSVLLHVIASNRVQNFVDSVR